MTLLKIGTLNVPRNRWLDALEVFDKVYVLCWDKEIELNNKNFIYIKISSKRFLNKFCNYVIQKLNSKKFLRFLEIIFIKIFRIINHSVLAKIKYSDIDYFHSSYNDFDESNFFTLLLPKKIKITRAQKETRIENNNLEYFCLKRCNRVILNDIECKNFFDKKYGTKFFIKKELLLNLDEDVRYSKLKEIIKYSSKLSKNDKRIHVAILAGRVLSNKSDKRSGGRLYYLDTIKDLLNANFVVHLHTIQIVPYMNDNPYAKLAKTNHDFIIEKPLDFENDPEYSYSVLSKYDLGILHAYVTNESVTLFDKVNVPHRYFEYLLAHVCPIVPRGKTIVTEKLFLSNNSGLVYDNLLDIKLNDLKKINYDNLFFSNYIKSIY